jgi:SAM-dependent methyltransferase
MFMKSEQTQQRAYYAASATQYDGVHVTEGDEHFVALSHISALVGELGIRSILDIGCGTGRGLAYLSAKHPGVQIVGLDPVGELLQVAVKKGLMPQVLVRGSGLELPFRTTSFDAVVECGVLHHVRDHRAVVRDMARVARRAIFLSDGNIFGQGRSLGIKLLKVGLYRAGLWRLVKFIQTGAKGYHLSEGDGLAYSYSVYFDFDLLSQWADRMITVPTRCSSKGRWSPVSSADTVLLCAIRDRGLEPRECNY